MGNRPTYEIDVYDVVGLVGFAVLEYGIARWSGSAALIVAGLALMTYAVLPYLRRPRVR